MGIDEILGDKREEILGIAAKHGVTPPLKEQITRILGATRPHS